MINERKITANLALISLSVKVSAPRRGMNTDPSTNEMTKETAILDTTKEERWGGIELPPMPIVTGE